MIYHLPSQVGRQFDAYPRPVWLPNLLTLVSTITWPSHCAVLPARAGLGDGRPRLGISHEDQMMMALSSVVSSWMHVVIWQAEMEKRDANGGS